MLSLFFASSVAAVQVTDGDTLRIDGEKIRIANIDAPEIREAKCDAERRLGIVAKARLEALLNSGDIEVLRGDPQDGRMKDRHGRTLATITVDGRDIGEILIAEKVARPWTTVVRPDALTLSGARTGRGNGT